MSVLWRGSEQNINQKNPLERMEGCALMSCFRLGLIRASSKRPNQKHTITFLQKVTILTKAINRNKPFYLAYGSPLILYVQDRCYT